MNSLFKQAGTDPYGLPLYIHRKYGTDLTLYQNVKDGDISKDLWTLDYNYKGAINHSKYSQMFLIEENVPQLKKQIDRNYKELKAFWRKNQLEQKLNETENKN